jgi:exodeoxyribonuclease VII large subunit
MAPMSEIPKQQSFNFEPPPAPRPAQPKPPEPRVYSVSQLNTLINTVLESHLPSRITVVGELTDFRCHSSGHCYFVLKEEGSQLPCVMWASSFRRVKFKPANGMALVLTGHIEVYVAGGRYQFYADTMEPEGKGALQVAFEQMVQRLRAEGLFADEHKKTLPAYPVRIGIVTSEDGAALHDIVSSISHRWPPAKLFLYAVPVQGPTAAKAIASAIADINRQNKRLRLELLIVGRGGGSLEDLWAFNEEVLARAIYNSRIPVISAVGHETDTTISDFVADARAATPTKAAVIAVPDLLEVQARLESLQNRLHVNARSHLAFAAQRLQTILASSLFRNPLGPVLSAVQRLDDFSSRLDSAAEMRVSQAGRRIQEYYDRILQIEPHRLINRHLVEIGRLESRLNMHLPAVISRRCMELERLESRSRAALWGKLAGSKVQFAALENRLAALNPRSVLDRGFTITRQKSTGAVVSPAASLDLGETIVTEFTGGNFIESSVTSKQNKVP